MITGVHHITAMVSDPNRTLKTYTKDLGLRLVKKTVNFDAPDIYHFYLGNGSGDPGTILTFFPFLNMKKGILGQGQLSYTGFSVPEASINWWETRLTRAGYLLQPVFYRFNQPVLRFFDHDGLGLELIGTDTDLRTPWVTSEIEAHHAIRGFYSVLLDSFQPKVTLGTLRDLLDYEIIEETEGLIRLASQTRPNATYVDLYQSADRGHPGAGTVHHLAFSTPDDQTQAEFSLKFQRYAGHNTSIYDRIYFNSIYFRDPGGILFEVATDTPGFMVDESHQDLGSRLKLPPWLEDHRVDIEQNLPSLDVI